MYYIQYVAKALWSYLPIIGVGVIVAAALVILSFNIFDLTGRVDTPNKTFSSFSTFSTSTSPEKKVWKIRLIQFWKNSLHPKKS